MEVPLGADGVLESKVVVMEETVSQKVDREKENRLNFGVYNSYA